VDHLRLRWIAISLVPLALALGLSAYAYVIYARAKSILNDVYALRVGASSTADVQTLAARHQSAIRELRCNNQECSVSFEIWNTWLYRTKLEPKARFSVFVKAENGTVSCLEVTLMRDTRVYPTMSSAGITQEYLKLPKRLVNFSSPPYWFPTPVGKPYLIAALTSQASILQREHAYAYSLKCLIKPGGSCDLPCDYLPLAWHDWEAELQGVGGFGPYYPDRGRCE
jgi:hypothetical protein